MGGYGYRADQKAGTGYQAECAVAETECQCRKVV